MRNRSIRSAGLFAFSFLSHQPLNLHNGLIMVYDVPQGPKFCDYDEVARGLLLERSEGGNYAQLPIR